MTYMEAYNDLQRFIILNDIELSEDDLRKFTNYVLGLDYEISLDIANRKDIIDDLESEVEDLRADLRDMNDVIESLKKENIYLREELRKAA